MKVEAQFIEPWDMVKEVLKGKFIATNAYIKKEIKAFSNK
jgi:hypothetical protein